MKYKIKKLQSLSPEVLAILFESIAMHLKAGISLEYIPELICQNFSNGIIHEATKAVALEIEKNYSANATIEEATFSNALKKTGIFPVYAIKSIQAAEFSGGIEEAIIKLSVHYRREKAFFEQIKQTFFAITILASIMTAVLLVSVKWIIPVFENILMKMGMYTNINNMNIILQLGKGIIITVGLLFAFIGIFSVVLLLVKEKQSEKLLSFCPITKSVLYNRVMAKTAEALALFLKSGLTPLLAFQYATAFSDNSVDKEKYRDCAKKLEQGYALGESLIKANVFTGIEDQLLINAEQCGQIDTILLKMANSYNETAMATAERVAVMVEPLLSFALIFSLGIILATILIPLLQIINGIT